MSENGNEDFWKESKNPKPRKRAKPKVQRVALDGEKVRDGLAQLVLTVVELLRELLERQAMQRMEKGSLSDDEVERLGVTFQNLRAEIQKLKEHFNLKDEDLNIDLGPLGALRDSDDDLLVEKASAVDLLDRLLSKGVVVKGDVIISVADVDLITLNLALLLASIEKAKELTGRDVRGEQLESEILRLRNELSKLKS